jgi:uncharacterized protein
LIIDVSDILNQGDTSKKFCGNINLDDISFQGDSISFPEPLDISGYIKNTGESLEMYAKITGYMVLPCSRCSLLHKRPIDMPLNLRFKRNGEPIDSEDLDVFVYTNKQIKLDDIALEYILLDLPIKRLCNDECKGICPHCGINLNEHECDCVKEDIDIRMEALRGFFADKDKEV